MFSELDPEIQQALVVVFVFFLVIFIPRFFSPKSRFKLREADRLRNRIRRDQRLADAKLSKRHHPLLLDGIRIDGAPHEILGVSPQASKKEILSAYKELMKQYHPDRVGPPGSREWQDAQLIAAAINNAKDALLRNQ